jgi:hypothetical protein
MKFPRQMYGYRTQIASDVTRDGLGIELLEGDNGDVVAEVFRYDQTITMVFNVFRPDLPFPVIEAFIARARKELDLPEVEDGIALPPTLVNEGLRPLVAPPCDFMPAEDAAEWAMATEHPVAFELVRRNAKTFGLRCSAWVAYRDAGGAVRAHGWQKVSNGPALITDSKETAKAYAASFAEGHGMLLSEWHSTTR